MLAGCTPCPDDVALRYRRNGWWTGDTLGDLLHAWADRSGHATALVHGAERISYRQLDERVERMAAGFLRAGLGPGDRVVLQLPNVPEFIEVAFALFRVGAQPVFCLTSHRAVEVRHLCEISGATGYVTPNVHRGFDHLQLASDLLAELPELRQVYVLGDRSDLPDELAPGVLPLSAIDAAPQPLPAVGPAEVAFFLLSGGTTALPKLIPRTHDDYAYQLRATGRLCGLTPDDVYLAALPVEFNFTWGCPGVLGTLSAGGRVVLSQDPTAENCFPLIAAERVSITSVVPTVARLWIEAASEGATHDLASLRTLQIGGAKLEPGLAARVEPTLGCQLQQVFGMAEGLLCMSRSTDDLTSRLHTQGRPISPGDEIRIVDEHGEDLPPGQTGELLTRGPYTLRGYFRAEEHNRRAFTPDGFYRTGDLARLTEQGHIVVEGRLKDVIIRGGDKIAAPEVERHLLQHPDVAAAAVVPVADEYLGERIFAFLVCPNDAPTLPALKRALHEQGLAEFKLPDRMELVDALPLTPLGKVDKKVLAAAAHNPADPRAWSTHPPSAPRPEGALSWTGP